MHYRQCNARGCTTMQEATLDTVRSTSLDLRAMGSRLEVFVRVHRRPCFGSLQAFGYCDRSKSTAMNRFPPDIKQAPILGRDKRAPVRHRSHQVG